VTKFYVAIFIRVSLSVVIKKLRAESFLRFTFTWECLPHMSPQHHLDRLLWRGWISDPVLPQFSVMLCVYSCDVCSRPMSQRFIRLL